MKFKFYKSFNIFSQMKNCKKYFGSLLLGNCKILILHVFCYENFSFIEQKNYHFRANMAKTLPSAVWEKTALNILDARMPLEPD